MRVIIIYLPKSGVDNFIELGGVTSCGGNFGLSTHFQWKKLLFNLETSKSEVSFYKKLVFFLITC